MRHFNKPRYGNLFPLESFCEESGPTWIQIVLESGFGGSMVVLLSFLNDFWNVYVRTTAGGTVSWLHFALVNPLVSTLQAYPFRQDCFTKVTFEMFPINIVYT